MSKKLFGKTGSFQLEQMLWTIRLSEFFLVYSKKLTEFFIIIVL